jgi:flagellar hook-associated protein 3 FlgL
MRIATSQLYASSVQTMENQQSQIVQLTQEISSGTSLATPADNPVGAAQAVQLSATGAALSQYTTNQSTALSTLQLEDTTLSSVTNVLQSVNQLVQRANNDSLNDSDRSALAQTLSGLRSQLMGLANTTDGTGNYIFSGFQSSSQPFANATGGGVQYVGDSGQRLVQVSGTRQISVSDPGSSVFMSVPSVGTSAIPAGSSSNTGTGTIGAVTVTDPTAATNSDNWAINFDDTSGTLEYTVTDMSQTPATPSAAQPYTAGSAISLGSGQSVTISGTPANGDSFSVTPAKASTDIFKTIDNVIAALSSPTSGSPSAVASLTNALATAQTQIENTLTNVTTVQASVGGRENEIQALQTVTSNSSLQVQNNLANLTSTNMTSTISLYEQVSSALSASQKTFAQTSSLSLFQYINP